MVLSTLVVAGGNISFNSIAAHRAGPDAYGAIAALMTAGTLSAFISVGVQYAVARRLGEGRGTLAQVVDYARRTLWPWALVALLALPATIPLATYIRLDGIAAPAMTVLYALLVVGLGVPAGMLTAQRRFGAYTAVCCLAVAVRLLLTLLLVRPGHAVIGAMVASTIGALIWVASCTAAAVRPVKVTQEHRTSAPPTWRVGAEGALGGLLSVVPWVLFGMPLLYVRHKVGGDAAGNFAAAQLLSSSVLFLTSPITTSHYPLLARTGEMRLAIQGLRWTLITGLATAAVAIACTPFAAQIVYGGRFSLSIVDVALMTTSATIVSTWMYTIWASRALHRGERTSAFLVGIGLAATAMFGVEDVSVHVLAAAPGMGVVAGCMLVLIGGGLRSWHRRVHAITALEVVGTRGEPAQVQTGSGLLGFTAVGIMAHNEASTIAPCLDAVLHESDGLQRVSTVVVVVSGSTDGTADVVREAQTRDGRIRLLCEPERSGKASAVNWFLRATQEPFCVLISADTVPAHGTIAKLVRPLGQGNVGMTGPRVVPLNPHRGVINRVVHVLWGMHHEVALRRPKLGEAVAFRRTFACLDTSTLTDEVSIEMLITNSGHGLEYVPEAIVYNHGPATLRDYLAQRRRIHRGHIGVYATTGYRPSTMRLRPLIVAVLSLGRRYPGGCAYFAIAVGLEALARAQAFASYCVRGLPRRGVWRTIATSKTHLEIPQETGAPLPEREVV